MTRRLSTITSPSLRNSPFGRDVLSGLTHTPRRLPSKYFYDQRGAELFEQICETDEYYVTRTETAIMRQHAPDMGRALGAGCMLIELGSGNSMKTRLLLDHLEPPAGYVPVDISRDQLLATAAELRSMYPQFEVLPVCRDFAREFSLPEGRMPYARRAVYFPGSTIGNFHPPQAERLLARLRELCGAGGGMLIGIDLKKDVAILERAYNDRAGVTEAFNMNMLARINRELGADFDLRQFRHRAFYNAERGRIEMHLVSCIDQSAQVLGEVISFRKGETIRTECSYKYDVDGFTSLAAAAGWQRQQTWTDADRHFGLLYLTSD